jgi:hypothetical protein
MYLFIHPQPLIKVSFYSSTTSGIGEVVLNKKRPIPEIVDEKKRPMTEVVDD